MQSDLRVSWCESGRLTRDTGGCKRKNPLNVGSESGPSTLSVLFAANAVSPEGNGTTSYHSTWLCLRWLEG